MNINWFNNKLFNYINLYTYLYIFINRIFLYFYKEYIYLIQIKKITFYEKFVLIFWFISLGGMPPLLGFLGKLILLKLSINYLNIYFLIIIIISSLIIFIIYIYLSFSILLLNPSNNKFYYRINKIRIYKIIFIINILGLILFIFIYL